MLGRIAAVATAFLIVAAAAIVAGRGESGSVSAQAQPTVTSSVIQLPPPIPGLDYTPPEPIQAAIPEAATTTGTPVAATDATGASAPASGGSVTASLGGSDVSVSSVGGSYEVDGPKRRTRRAPRR